MHGRSPAGPLIAEHRVIERMIGVMRAELESMAQSRNADSAWIEQLVDFIRSYADRCHHGKEEDILFARLAEKDLDADLAAAMQELIDDHVYARRLTGQLVDANQRYMGGQAEALAEIETAIRELVAFYPVHIAKEDQGFFRASMACFSDTEQAQMLADFAEFDRTLIHERYRLLVDRLEKRGHDRIEEGGDHG